MFTQATCIPPINPAANIKSPITEAFSCALEADKHLCQNGGGVCQSQRDGYYITNIVCVIIGAVTFWMYIQGAVLKLQNLPLRAWRVFSGDGSSR